MNKHIELVEKWLADPSSVSKEELDDNHYSAHVTTHTHATAATAAYAAANCTHATAATEWVAKYHKEVKDLGQ